MRDFILNGRRCYRFELAPMDVFVPSLEAKVLHHLLTKKLFAEAKPCRRCDNYCNQRLCKDVAARVFEVLGAPIRIWLADSKRVHIRIAAQAHKQTYGPLSVNCFVSFSMVMSLEFSLLCEYRVRYHSTQGTTRSYTMTGISRVAQITLPRVFRFQRMISPPNIYEDPYSV